MLVSKRRPSQFRLSDSRGQEKALAEFLGRRRVVLIFNPDAAYFDALSGHQDGLIERDMVVLAILPPAHPLSSRPASPPLWVLTDGGGRMAAVYGVPTDGPFFCLIGKDGTVKQAGQNLPTPAELFETIDAMPMRRQEVRERERQGGAANAAGFRVSGSRDDRPGPGQ